MTLPHRSNRDVFAASETELTAVLSLSLQSVSPPQAAPSEMTRPGRLKELLQALQAEGWLNARCVRCSNLNARRRAVRLRHGFRARRGYGGRFRGAFLIGGACRHGPPRAGRLGPPVCDRMAARSRGNSPPCMGRGERTDHSWGFLALWEWNDAWSAASESGAHAPMTRNATSPSRATSRLGINIAGRHRLDWASRWHHRGAVGGAVARTR